MQSFKTVTNRFSLSAGLRVTASLAAGLLLSFSQRASANSLDLEGFLTGVEQSKSFNDLTTYLRSQPLDEHSAFGLLSSIDGTPRSAERPQVVSKIGNVWSGMGGKFYDVIIASGDATRPLLYFQLTEAKGRLVINDDPELTVEKIKKMPRAEFITWNAKYGKQECYSCHKGRLLIELEDQPRRFSHEDLRFKDQAVQSLFSQAEKSQLERFLNREKGPRDVRYAWIFSFLKKVKNGIQTSDLFNYRRYTSEVLHDNANESFLKISSSEKFSEFKLSVVAALANRSDFQEILARESNRSISEIQAEFEQLTLSQAQSLLSFKQTRNTAILNGAFAQASPEIQEQASRLNVTGGLLLNQKAIIDIGPRLLDILLPDENYRALSAAERRNFASEEQFAITDRQQIAELTERGRERMEIRAKFTLVAKHLATDKFFHLSQMSSSIRPSAETQSGELNSLDLLFNRFLKETLHVEPSLNSKRAVREMPVDQLIRSLKSTRTDMIKTSIDKSEDRLPLTRELRLPICREAF